MISTIVFDLSEVYLQGILGVEQHLANVLGHKPDDIYEQTHGQEMEDLFFGRITEAEYWKKLVDKFNWQVSVEKLKLIVRENFQEIEGVRELIENLKVNGYKLGLLSVHAKEWIDHCEKKFDFHKLFDSRLYSFEVDIHKPNKKVYEMILERLKAKAPECVYIDDHFENLKPAEELGIKVIEFHNVNQLKDALKKLEVKINRDNYYG